MELRVLLSPIHISAMGLVNVDLNLLPTVNNSKKIDLIVLYYYYYTLKYDTSLM